jgi:membrane-associated phospholipid phosphatase
MIIAAAALYVNLPLGIFTAVCGLLLAVLRVITGVHFPKDVAAGCLIAVLLGWIGFYLV